MTRRITFLAVVTLVIVLAATPAALAGVTFDPTTATGFVGKGDVQTAFGWTNAQAQNPANLAGLAFTYVTTDTYEVTNAWASGNADNPVSLNAHQVTVTTIVGVNGIVAYESRQIKGQKQVTGFYLCGFKGDPVITGTLPVVSPTVTYVTYSWDTQEWTGNWIIDPVTGKKVKEMVTVTHTTDQLPAYYDEAGNLVLYTEGDDKAVLSATLLDSTGGLYVQNGAAGTPVQIWPPPPPII